MAASDSPRKMSVLPGVVQMIGRVVLARIVPNPLPIGVNVRRVGVSRLVGEIALLSLCGRVRRRFGRRRSMCGDVAAGRRVRGATPMFAAMLLRG